MSMMMNGMGSTMAVGMGLLCLLVILALVLVTAAAVKYLFFDKRDKR
ncbi:hypothetical protein [Piscinibacter koreensis]|uniref:Uncharacterized protein n=1 Tax=Piscinibacter koreensis TaxID=2742824 RepID=A0A7Y6TYU0_9BURK|nr:hypothetical protein [Schlegelella koreensis]NUZ08465.1 hypothetical protein [Schlegelella koreensis]